MAKMFANSGDPDQMLHPVASDLGLHCLPGTLLGVSRLQWVNPLTLKVLSIIVTDDSLIFIINIISKKTRLDI